VGVVVRTAVGAPQMNVNRIHSHGDEGIRAAFQVGSEASLRCALFSCAGARVATLFF